MRAEITMQSAAGQVVGSRSLTSHARDCSELAAAAALAIALAIDPLAAQRMDAASPAPSVAPSSPAQSAAPASVGVSPPPPSPSPSSSPLALPGPHEHDRLQPFVAVGALVAWGSAPIVAVGVAASVGLRWRSLSLSLEGRYDPPVSDGTVTVSQLLVGVTACINTDEARWGTLGGCVSALAGTVTIPVNMATPIQNVEPDVLVGGRIIWESPHLGPLSFFARFDAFVSLAPVDVNLEGNLYWSEPWGQLDGAAGLMLRFR